MPIEMNLWRIEDDRPHPLVAAGIDQERRLESILADDISVLGLGSLMLLGRQVLTDHGARVDLLALDESGTVYVIELKRARTPREVVAQVLDYGSWARNLGADSLARIFESGPFARDRTFTVAFADHFDAAPRKRSTRPSDLSSSPRNWMTAPSALWSTYSTTTGSRSMQCSSAIFATVARNT